MAISDSTMQMNGRNIEHKARSCVFDVAFLHSTHTYTYWQKRARERHTHDLIRRSTHTMEASALARAHTHFIKHLSWRNFAHSLCALQLGFVVIHGSAFIHILYFNYTLIPVSCRSSLLPPFDGKPLLMDKVPLFCHIHCVLLVVLLFLFRKWVSECVCVCVLLICVCACSSVCLLSPQRLFPIKFNRCVGSLYAINLDK